MPDPSLRTTDQPAGPGASSEHAPDPSAAAPLRAAVGDPLVSMSLHHFGQIAPMHLKRLLNHGRHLEVRQL